MTPLVTLLPLLLLGALAQEDSDWKYSDQDNWSKEYAACGGRRQSPINLQAKKVQYRPSRKGLRLIGYEAQDCEFIMTNIGKTVTITLPSSMHLVTPDGTKYKAEQMHFHWGGASSEISGSEHTIEGIRYVAEMHIMHYNSKYNSFNEAQNASDGLATLAALIEISDLGENTYFSNFISHLENIKYSGQSTVLNSLDLQDMLPQNLHDHYSYKGSISAPPCTENVRWFVLADTIKLSRAQISKLENSLLDSQNNTLQNNYRQTQPLNNRVVEVNFKIPRKHREVKPVEFLIKTAETIVHEKEEEIRVRRADGN